MWQQALAEVADKAAATMAALVNRVRSEMGTDAVFDPEYIRRAERAEKWLNQRGETLIPTSGQETLGTFFERYYFPMRLKDASPGTAAWYRVAMRRWALVTGDPALTEINGLLLARFRDVLQASKGMQAHKRMSPFTVMRYLSAVQTVLDLAGPRYPRHRDAAGILPESPWLKPVRTYPGIPKVVPIEHVQAVSLATASMDKPVNPGIKPPAWWRALIAVCYNTALRADTLLRLRWEWVDLPGRRILIPAQAMKSKRPHVVPLNDVAYQHLQTIHVSGAELVFPLPANRKQFWIWLHKLMDFAGIPREEHFGFHALRRTHATRLWETSPQAAQLSLGHTGMDVTIGHYVAAEAIVARAVAELPQPAAFLRPE